MEKHTIEGHVLFPAGMLLKVDGRDASHLLPRFQQDAHEFYEGDVGDQERIIVRIERERRLLLGTKVRVHMKGRLAQVFRVRAKRSSRDVIFQVLLPGIFLFLIAYYAFAHRSEVMDFYYGKVLKQPVPQKQNQRQAPHPSGLPMPVKQKQLAGTHGLALRA